MLHLDERKPRQAAPSELTEDVLQLGDRCIERGGSRLEVDGQLADTQLQTLSVSFRPAVATVVSFSGQEPLFAGLRRRQIIIDSPRILAEDPPA